MANHTEIHTRKHMIIDKIKSLLDDLNKTVFKDSVQYIEYNLEDSLGGLLIQQIDWDINYGMPIWLNSRQNLEFRLSIGSNFMWWVYFVLIDKIAQEFNGTIKDDGRKFNQYGVSNNYRDYVENRVENIAQPIIKFGCRKFYLSDMPKQYKRNSQQK